MQGTDGRNANFGYDKGSTECIKNLPPGWADWMHLPDSSFATGRRLLSPPGTKSAETSKSPRMIVKLLRSTGQLSPEEGANYTDIHFDSFASLSGPEAFPGNKVPSRKLLQVKGASSAATKGVPCTTWAHVDNGVTREVKSPFCSETGLKLYQSSRAKTKHAKRKIAHQCAVSVDVPASSYNNLTLLTQVIPVRYTSIADLVAVYIMLAPTQAPTRRQHATARLVNYVPHILNRQLIPNRMHQQSSSVF